MRAIKYLLILGVCVGLNLEAGHHCACKPKVTKEMKREKKAHHHEAHKKTKKAFKEMRKREKEEKNKCYCTGVFHTIPADKVLVDNGKIKRDANGDRV
jgi:hypothetical protein